MSEMCRRRPAEIVAAELAVIQKFADALASGDIRSAGALLERSGHFMVSGKRGEDRPVSKRAFVIWLTRQWNTYAQQPGVELPIRWTFDRCFDCVIGRPVLLLDDGRFPVKNRHPWQTVRTGLALEVENGHIVSSLLCSHFMLHENPFIKPDPIDPEALLEEPGIQN
jgi:hypothetical protein